MDHKKPISYPPYAMIAVFIALAFWFFDSSAHYFLYNEPGFEWVPSDFNELWMRSSIAFLITAMGFYSQISTRKLLLAEYEKLKLQEELNLSLQRELELQRKQIKLTKETVLEMHDIINNFLNNLLLFQIEARESKSISDDSLELFDRLVKEAAANVRELGETAIEKSS